MAKELFLIPTSFAQQRLWFLDQLEPGSSVFNIPAALRISGRLDIDVLRRSVEEVVNRHETLRTRFIVTEDGEPAQIIESSATVGLSVLDLRSLAEDARRERVRELMDEEARRGFDLSRGPLLRTSLLRIDEEQYLLLFTMHHIISDAWSMGVLVREISVLYEALSRDAASPLPPLSIQYADYAVWQRERLESGELEQQLDYWVDRLADLPDVLVLPTDYSRSAASSHRGGAVSFAIPAELSADLKALGRREGASLFITLMAGFQALLFRHSGQTRFAVGTPVAGRQRPELQDLIGFFVNTLALPADLSGDPSFVELLQRVRTEALAAYAHQEAPFERVVERLQPARTLDRAPLFQVMLALDNTPQQSLTLAELKIDREAVSSGTAKYDLSLLIEEREKGVAGVWFYDADLFDEASVKRLGERFSILLEGFVADPSLPVSRVPLLAKEEEQLLLVKGNDTSVPFPSEICIHELFEELVRRTPDAGAVMFEGERLTYAELNAKANQIASYLRSLGVGPESRVGILMERSIDLVAAILGTLKAGGAYVPLDPEYPRDRLAFMIKDSGVAVLLTQSELAGELPSCDAPVVFVNKLAEFAPAENIAPKSETSSDNLAYIIYTSGSTGIPKGVCVSHRSLVNYTLGVTNALGLNGGLTFAMVSTPAADLGNTVLYPSISTGGCLHLISRERAADAAALAAYFEEHAIDCLKIVPSHLSALLAGEEAQKILPRRCLALGGEASSWSLIDRVKSLSDCAIFNHYGPTETTVGVLTHAVTDDRARRLPLGRPLPNIKVYILDTFFNPAPIGVIGELYIGGEALARGYHERPATTAEKFIPDPFSGKAGGRLYRTGDLARYFADGTIEFLGRADNQVKVRGYRIELGEIETALREHPLVRDAAVVAWEEPSSEVSLAAYVVAKPAVSTIERGELRQFLSDKLPRHMLPGSFTVLDEIPLTPNGKVNRQALPKPERDARASLEVSKTATEEILAGIYEELLGIGKVGVLDDFFELGGHSLLATRLLSRVRQRFGVEVALRKVFETPTVRGLAAQIDEARGLGQAPDEHIQRSDTESSPLSPAQQRLWFLDQLEPGSSFYNLPGAVRLRGALDLKAFERSLNEVVRRHEILRATFPMIGGEAQQRIKPNFYLPLPVTDLTSLPDDEREAEAQRLCDEEAARPFNLSSGPQIRAQLLRLGEQDHFFLLTMHHIVADGWAMGIFIREVDALYQAFTRGLPSPLAELPIQYGDFANWQQQRLAGGILERDLEYWSQRLADAPDLLALPTDFPRPPVQSYKGATFEFALSLELTEALKDLSRREGATLFMTLLAGFAVLLQRHAGQDDIVVGTPVAGRQQPETENLIGIFINMLVMRVDLSGDPSFVELLQRVRAEALAAYAHQEAPFERVVERLQPTRALDRAPLFQVMLALDNTPQQSLTLAGLDAQRLPLRGTAAKYDLTFSLEESATGLRGVVEFRSDLFAENTARRLAERYLQLLQGAVADPAAAISQLPLLTATEQQQLLVEWNQTEREYPATATLPQLFEEQARRTPHAVALVFEDQSLTYAELDAHATHLAHRLHRLGVGPESRVGILLDRSLELVVALLGVLKAGAAYVPLDAEYPAERLAFMAQDAGLSLVLTNEARATLAATWNVPALTVSPVSESQSDAIETENLPHIDPDNLAYVIYTSGSTGIPKGVCISHRNVVNLFTAMDEKLNGPEPGVWLALTSISFDISVLELFWTLSRGFKVVLQGKIDLIDQTRHLAAEVSAKPIDFSLFYFASDDNIGGDDTYELLLEGAKFADQHGFSAIWTPERHFHAFGGTYPNPSVTSAAIAAITNRIEIRAGSVVIPLHDPLRVAEEWAVVDKLSKGRVAISFASGWHANDFVLAPDSYENRHEVMYRNIELVRRLWRGEPIMRRTGAGNEIEVRIHPRPVQPELRFWITAAGNPETFRTAGRLGANLLTHLLGQTVAELTEKIAIYRKAWLEHGHGPGKGHVTLMLHTFIGEDLETVRDLVRTPFSNYLRSSISLLRNSARSLGRDLDSGQLTETDMQAVLAHAFDRYFGTAALLGTPESCLPMIERLKKADVDEVGCLIDFGVDQKQVLASLPSLTTLKERSNRSQRADGDYSLPAQIRRHGVTHLQLTPSMARLLLADEETRAAVRGVQKLLIGGEIFTASLARQLRDSAPGEVHNMYGPTETTVWSTTHQLDGVGDSIPIGPPIANTVVRILDRAMRLSPPGVPGEIYIGGEGLARGYLNRPSLTAERFVPDPFSLEAGARLYRTGDLARYSINGEIEILGRLDNQVKIRGFRIELGEIEAVLRSCPGIKEAVVIAREHASGDKRLLAYLVPSADALQVAAVRSFLHQKLPSHQIPSTFTFLEELPLTPNKKVNVHALPDPAGTEPSAVGDTPESETEQNIAAVWSEVLDVAGIGAHDNFFEIGGTSLLVVQVNARLREVFNREIPIVEMFRNPTVSTLARFLEGGAEDKPSFDQAQNRAAQQANAMSRQKRLAQARSAGRSSGPARA